MYVIYLQVVLKGNNTEMCARNMHIFHEQAIYGRVTK